MGLSLIHLKFLFACVAMSIATSPANAQRTVDGETRLSAVPVSFQGKWRPDLGQCDDMTERGLDLDAQRVSYYANSGPIKLVRQKNPRSIVATYTARESESGRNADRTVSYDISRDGRHLSETNAWGDRVHYVRCDSAIAQTTTQRPAPISIESVTGGWEDGGPACASIQPGKSLTTIIFRGWYCEAGERSATPIILERLGGHVFTHAATGLHVLTYSDRMMQIEAGERSRKQFGDGLYVTEPGRMYSKASAASRKPELGNSAQMPQLRTGAYVRAGTTCQKASNATLEWWNGQFFSGGRKHPAYPRPTSSAQTNGSQPFVASSRNWEDNKVIRVNIVVLSPSIYERDGVRYSHCADNRLPQTWRGETPPQKKLSAEAVLESDARVAAISPKEFREWQGNGNSYGFLCTVSTANSSLTIRSAPAGPPMGSVSNGELFVLMDVRVTAEGETWYSGAASKQKGTGWVSAQFVTCDAQHFD